MFMFVVVIMVVRTTRTVLVCWFVFVGWHAFTCFIAHEFCAERIKLPVKKTSVCARLPYFDQTVELLLAAGDRHHRRRRHDDLLQELVA